MIGLVFAVLYVGAFGALFVELEHRGDRHRIAAVALLVLVVEGALAGGAASVPVGALRPSVFGQDFRPEDAVVVAALFARLLNGERGRRGLAGWWVLWAGFLIWFVAGAGVGVLSGAAVGPVLFEAKLAFYVLGCMVIGSGAEARRLAADLNRIAPALACTVIISFGLRVVGLSWSLSTPFQRFPSLGVLSNDLITVLACTGVAILVLQGSGYGRTWLRTSSGLTLLAAPLGGQQRASYAVVAVMLAVIGALSLGRTWRRRMVVSHTEIGLALGLVIFFGALTVMAPGSSSPVLLRIDKAFAGEAEAGSADARLLLARAALSSIADHPLVGSGLGAKVMINAPVSGREVSAAAHNLVLDLALRGGLVSIALFGSALAATAIGAMRVWRRSSGVESVIALAALLCLVAVVSKSFLEPALFKFRLSCVFGFSLGLLLTLDTDAERKHRLSPSGVTRSGTAARV